MSRSQTVDITINNKRYEVGCPPDERPALDEAVNLLNGKMSALLSKTGTGGERLATMVALNLAHELVSRPAKAEEATPVANESADNSATAQTPSQCAEGAIDVEAIQRRIEAIETKLDAALAGLVQEDVQEELF